MHHFFLARIFLLLSHYGYGVLFPIAVIEGPVAALIAGGLVASGELDAFVVFLLLVVADLTGDSIYYGLGRWSHEKFLDGMGKRLGLTQERIEPLYAGFKKHDWKLLLIGKTQALGSVVLYFAGAVRMPFFKFLMWNLVGTIPKIIIFELAGYFFGQSLIRSARYLDYVSFITLGIGVALLIAYWYFRRYMEREMENQLG